MARTDSKWNQKGSWIQTIFDGGINILINGLNKYLNFNTISGSDGYGFRDNNGVMEYKDAAGNWTAFSAGTPAAPTWDFYATNWTTEPTFVENITGGAVYSYTLDAVTRYRFVPSPYDAALDAFYTSYSSPTLSGLIVTRG